MEVVQPNSDGLKKAIRVLRRGGVIVYPTDTAYALGGLFNSPKVIKKILKIKNRRDSKFTLIAADVNQVKKVFVLSPTQSNLGKKYWPGPLSIVVSKKFAVRVPNHDLARTLAKKAACPLIATSANLTGEKTPYSSRAIIKCFNEVLQSGLGVAPDLIIDAGSLPKIKPSTVVAVDGRQIKLIRLGTIKPEF